MGFSCPIPSVSFISLPCRLGRGPGESAVLVMFDPEDSMFRLAFAALSALILSGSALAYAADWPPAAPDLAISILPSAPACLEADDCYFLIRIENLGGAAYEGPIGFKQLS